VAKMHQKPVDPFRQKKSQANEWINKWIPKPVQILIFLIVFGLVNVGLIGLVYVFVNLPEWLPPFWGPIIVLLIFGLFARGGIFFIIAAILLFAVGVCEKYNFPITKLWH
jgi:hypothetical protein